MQKFMIIIVFFFFIGGTMQGQDEPCTGYQHNDSESFNKVLDLKIFSISKYENDSVYEIALKKKYSKLRVFVFNKAEIDSLGERHHCYGKYRNNGRYSRRYEKEFDFKLKKDENLQDIVVEVWAKKPWWKFDLVNHVSYWLPQRKEHIHRFYFSELWNL